MNTTLENRATILNAAILATIGVAEMDAAELLMLDARRTNLREQLAIVQKEYIAKLPFATDDQLAQVVLATRNETQLPEGSRLNVDFRLSQAQGQQVETARKARVAELETLRDGLMTDLMNDKAEKLVSFKVRVGAKQTITNLRFVRTHTVTVPAAGLLAKLHSAVGTKEEVKS